MPWICRLTVIFLSALVVDALIRAIPHWMAAPTRVLLILLLLQLLLTSLLGEWAADLVTDLIRAIFLTSFRLAGWLLALFVRR